VITLVPAYGRDYKSKAAVQADWDADKDFIIASYGHPWDTKPTNKSQWGGAPAMIRYGNLRKTYEVE
jgi:hypothetical protein